MTTASNAVRLRGAVVVGVDGSASADVALDWAAAQAELDGTALLLLHAAAPPALSGSGWLESRGVEHREVLHQLRDEARRLLNDRCSRVAATHPRLRTERVVRLEDPRAALLDAATEARLLVVGTRGVGRVRRLLLGSVSGAVAHHAACPAVVARAGGGSAGVVAGVVDAPGDGAVLDLAFAVAATRDLPLTVLHCGWDQDRGGTPPDQVRAHLEAALRPYAESRPRVRVALAVLQGFADEHLVRASQDAALVVVGRRHKPYLNELVFGSVAPVVVERAACSVAVVPVGE